MNFRKASIINELNEFDLSSEFLQMGNTNSQNLEPPSLVMDHQQSLPYPDMNLIFKGIPKMIQVKLYQF